MKNKDKKMELMSLFNKYGVTFDLCEEHKKAKNGMYIIGYAHLSNKLADDIMEALI